MCGLIVLSTLVVMTVSAQSGEGQATTQAVYNAANKKQLFIDDMLIARMHRLKLTVNRPVLTGDKCIHQDVLPVHRCPGPLVVLLR